MKAIPAKRSDDWCEATRALREQFDAKPPLQEAVVN
jgi:hypothetical protein